MLGTLSGPAALARSATPTQLRGIVKPDFSGEYALNLDASALSAIVAPRVQTASLRIEHRDPQFSCAGTFQFLDSEPIQWAFELAAVDGSAPDAAGDGYGLRWDGPSLVLTTGYDSTRITFRYDLDRDGHLRLAERLRGTDHDQDNLWVFDRR